MAEKRMIAKDIIENDTFLELPDSTKLLYIYLNLNADDDGFIDSPNKVMRIIGAKKSDLTALVETGYLIEFDSSLYVVTHWLVHNTVRKDLYKKTTHQVELSALKVDSITKIYSRNETVTDTLRTRDDDGTDSLHRLDKNRLDKNRLKSKGHFVPPTLTEIQAYITEQGYQVDAQTFLDYYESNGWMVGRNHMKDWKATIRRWNSTEKKPKPKQTQFHQFEQRPSSDYDAFIKMVEGGNG